jgi:hypothetical protein
LIANMFGQASMIMLVLGGGRAVHFGAVDRQIYRRPLRAVAGYRVLADGRPQNCLTRQMGAAYSAAFDILFMCIYQKQPQDNASESSPGSTTSAMPLTTRASSHAPGL